MGPRPLIVVVEDEESIAKGLRFNFELEGYEVLLFSDGPAVLRHFSAQPGRTDLVVLDLMLPGMSGYEICRAIREFDPRVPVLVLSARTLAEDRAHAFDCGTDQYMSKPFALPELLSRVRNLLDRERRLQANSQPADAGPEQIRLGDVEVNFRTFQVQRGTESTPLTTMEAQLLRYFVQHAGAVLSRQQILRDVWEQDANITTRTIDNFVLRLRRLIERDSTSPAHLLSVRGTGYRFVLQPEENQPAAAE
jgi:DNA-binding response OmpR family regulator